MQVFMMIVQCSARITLAGLVLYKLDQVFFGNIDPVLCADREIRNRIPLQFSITEFSSPLHIQSSEFTYYRGTLSVRNVKILLLLQLCAVLVATMVVNVSLLTPAPAPQDGWEWTVKHVSVLHICTEIQL